MHNPQDRVNGIAKDELQDIFGRSSSGHAEVRRLSVLSRHGHALLYLPRERRLSLPALALYPAQRPLARMARSAVRALLAMGLAPVLPTTRLALPAQAPFTEFLERLTPGTTVPAFAILAGNPHAAGRRFIFLLFDQAAQPTLVVKAGLGEAAAALIQHEGAFLSAVPPEATGIPGLRARHQADGVHALAMDHLKGHAPTEANDQRMADVLGSWLDPGTTLAPEAIPAWRRLMEVCGEEPLLRTACQRLQKTPIHPVLYHGDFAPWNVKVASNGQWQVLDWERGERVGMPCWDWFHYRLQTGLLVDRFPLEQHVQQIEQWINAEALRHYASRAGVAPVLRELFLAHLLYSMKIIGPSESLPVKRDLLNTLAAKWTSA